MSQLEICPGKDSIGAFTKHLFAFRLNLLGAMKWGADVCGWACDDYGSFVVISYPIDTTVFLQTVQIERKPWLKYTYKETSADTDRLEQIESALHSIAEYRRWNYARSGRTTEVWL